MYPFTRPSFAVAVALTGLLLQAGPATAATCESLSGLKFNDATITLAQSVAAGAFTPPATEQRGGARQAGAGAAAAAGGGRRGAGPPADNFSDVPAFCRVAATLRPSRESDIKIEVWLPASGWNGKFQAVGNRGWEGRIEYGPMATALRRGYATASTDNGHTGGGGPWMQSREKVIDYGYRAVHEMAVKAKAIMGAFYDAQPRFSYFNACSSGGRQGLKAATQYPDDFDGVVAGAPVVNATGRASFGVAVSQFMNKEPGSFIPQSKHATLHNAVLQACDGVDGVKDGVLEDPRACKFDPQVLACSGPDSDSCLTPLQIEAARRMYQPLKNPRTGQDIFPGYTYGSELGWNVMGGERPFGIATDFFRFMVFNDPEWDYKTLNFDEHMARAGKLEAGIVNVSADLRKFVAGNGKAILYHGWSDPQYLALSSPEYYGRVAQTLGGEAKAKESVRLFMVPGMNHCTGGPGATSFDMLAALETWVENGKAPDQIVASKVTNGKTERTRPLCPFPQVATYKGSGSTDEAANFSCKAP